MSGAARRKPVSNKSERRAEAVSGAYRTLDVELPAKCAPLLEPHRYKGTHGGRGSSKSTTVAAINVADCIADRSMRVVCLRETQKSLKYSAKQLFADTIQRLNVGIYFEVTDKMIRVRSGKSRIDDGMIIFDGLQNHTAESIKSLEGFDRYLLTEAQGLTKESLRILRPTARRTSRHGEQILKLFDYFTESTIEKRGSRRAPEIWADWNPMLPTDGIDELFRSSKVPLPDSVCIQLNYSDNPWFPEDLRRDMEADYARDPALAAHVWGGGYFVDDENQIIAYEWLMDARDRGMEGWSDDGSIPSLRISVDVADGGVDSTVITAVRRYQSFEVLLRQEKHDFPSAKAPVMAANAAEEMFNRFDGKKLEDDIVVDANGVGAGTAGVLIDREYRVIRYIGGAKSDNAVRYRNRRVQSNIVMRDKYRDGKIIIDKNAFDDQRDWDEYVSHMTMLRRRPGLERVEDVETKEHLVQRTGKSPDRAESHAMSYATQLPEEPMGGVKAQDMVAAYGTYASSAFRGSLLR